MDDKQQLELIGIFGHTFVVLVDSGHYAGYDLSSARAFAEKQSSGNPRIYHKRGAKWIRVKN